MQATHLKKRRIICVVAMASLSLILFFPSFEVFALPYPPYIAEGELHGIVAFGAGAYVRVFTSTLHDDNPQWWALSYTNTINTITGVNAAVGSGYTYFHDTAGGLVSKAVWYKWDGTTGIVGYTFKSLPGSNPFPASVQYFSYDSAKNCYNWYRITDTVSGSVCIKGLPSGYARTWSTSSSSLNVFSSSTEYTGAKYASSPSGGGWTLWSTTSASIYCKSISPFDEKSVTNKDNWNVIPPGTGDGCTAGYPPPDMPG